MANKSELIEADRWVLTIECGDDEMQFFRVLKHDASRKLNDRVSIAELSAGWCGPDVHLNIEGFSPVSVTHYGGKARKTMHWNLSLWTIKSGNANFERIVVSLHRAGWLPT